jgi:hypothetical protein
MSRTRTIKHLRKFKTYQIYTKFENNWSETRLSIVILF